MAHTKINYVLIVVFLVLLFTNCKKQSSETTTVEFVITNPADKSPFVGVPVKLIEEKNSGGGISSKEFLEGKTDNNGRIRFEFQAMRTSKYWYTPIIDESYFGSEETWTFLKRPSPSAYTVIKDIYNEIEYEITYYAYLKKKYKNINCEGPTDTLIYRAWSSSVVYGSRAYDYEATRTGCVDYETGPNSHWWPDGYALVFQGWHKIDWEVRRNNFIETGIDSIYIDKGETGTLEIIY